MPHQARLDAPDALHHVKVRGLNERLHFRPRLPWEGCQAYRPFVSPFDQCRVALPLEWSGYKRFDQGLWILGHVIDQETIDIPTWAAEITGIRTSGFEDNGRTRCAGTP